jgi:hypothetical protein
VGGGKVTADRTDNVTKNETDGEARNRKAVRVELQTRRGSYMRFAVSERQKVMTMTTG